MFDLTNFYFKIKEMNLLADLSTYSSDVAFYIYVCLAIINIVVATMMGLSYFTQYIYTIVALFIKKKTYPDAKINHKYGIIIPAHNEEKVVANLIRSIRETSYPQDKLVIFVLADNCNDHTFEVASKEDCIVYKRNDPLNVGKSYGLNFIFKKILTDENFNDLEAFFIFDADNLVTKDYFIEMNKMFDLGYEVSTSFRNSKNYGSSFSSMGQSISFFREACIIHKSRSYMKMGTYVSGTGFYLSRNILLSNKGWNWFTLVEDIEFSIVCAIDNINIGYNENAIFYDEQPIKFMDSINQRARWCKGTVQCFFKYEGKLIKGLFKPKKDEDKKIKANNFILFDLANHIFVTPAVYFVYSIIFFIVNICYLAFGLYSVNDFVSYIFNGLLSFLIYAYIVVFLMGLIAMIKCWKVVKASSFKKILGIIIFPLFMSLYLPIYGYSLFFKVKWRKIPHSVDVGIDEI